jgi:hypothetical protein
MAAVAAGEVENAGARLQRKTLGDEVDLTPGLLGVARGDGEPVLGEEAFVPAWIDGAQAPSQ